jgi:hypothetical protein
VTVLSGPPGIGRSTIGDAVAGLHRSRPFVRLAEPTWARVEAVTADTAPWADDVRRLDAARPAEGLARTVLAEVASRSSAGGAA